MTASRAEDILDFAELQMRKGGYDAVSFRDIAREIGIKSASVHYHFPTKADLGQAVTARYAERFVASLGDPSEGTKKTRIERLTDAYKAAYAADGAACLCAVLGATTAYLPVETSAEVRQFYARLVGWSEAAFGDGIQGLAPASIIALLQGAMVLALASGEATALDDASAFLTRVR